jgi:hypothetical protein
MAQYVDGSIDEILLLEPDSSQAKKERIFRNKKTPLQNSKK